MDAFNAWPMCRLPVTFGGGIAITKVSPSESGSDWYRPSASQACCQRASTPSGE